MIRLDASNHNCTMMHCRLIVIMYCIIQFFMTSPLLITPNLTCLNLQHINNSGNSLLAPSQRKFVSSRQSHVMQSKRKSLFFCTGSSYFLRQSPSSQCCSNSDKQQSQGIVCQEAGVGCAWRSTGSAGLGGSWWRRWWWNYKRR